MKILEKFFTSGEAKMACCLETESQTPAEIAEKAGLDRRQVSKTLIRMVKKGLIEIDRYRDEKAFKLIPFIAGFYEHQNA